MAMTLREILGAPDMQIHEGITGSVRGLVSHRDGDVDLDTDGYRYDLGGCIAETLEARIRVHVKNQEIWDDGDGRDGLDVIHFDGRPIAVVREEGYDSFTYRVEVIDLAGVDELVAAVRALRVNRVTDLAQKDLDEDVSESLGLCQPLAPAI